VQADTSMYPFRIEGPSAELAAIPGRQEQAFGQALAGVGDAALRIATDMHLEANRVQVVSAQNKARAVANDLAYGAANGFYGLKGEAAINPRNGESIVTSYEGKLRTALTDIESGLGNDVQKQAFALWRDSFESDFRGTVQRHQMSEFKSHQISTYKGAAEMALYEAGRNWSNPDKARAAIDGLPVPGDPSQRYGGVRESAYQIAKAQGKSETEASYEAKRAASAAHLAIVGNALGAQQISYAKKHLDEHKDDMLGADVLKANEHLSRHLDSALARAATTATVKEMAGRIQPTSMDRLNGIVLGLESGGRDTNQDGTPLTSSKGARYAMQVMPETAKNPGFGIKPVADDTPEEYNRVGRQYLAALVTRYGNVGQVLGAYNAGPGAMDKAIEQAKQDGRPESWGSYLPAETQQYVRKGVVQYSAGGGAPAMPTEYEFVQAAADKLGPGASPEAVKATQQAAEHQYGVIIRSIKAQEDNAFVGSMRWLEANGGRYADIPDSLKGAVKPDKWDDLRSYGKKVAKGDDSTTNMALYQKLATDTNYLKGLTDNAFYQFRTELSEGDFKHFVNERAKLVQGKGSESPQDLNTSAINTVLNDRLRTMGRDPTPKDGSKEAATLGEMRKYVRESILNAQAVTGKKMTDAEVEKHVDGLFVKSVAFQSTFLGFDFGNPAGKQMLAMTYSDIPGSVRDRIKADFRKKGVGDPTDADVLGVYWRLKSK
jgi:soluble lytic murein transglycosylase